MPLFRNREIKVYTVILASLSLIFIVWGFLKGYEAGIIVTACVIIISASFYLFTYYRYKEISRLSNYLRRICSGEHSLDIRDNFEGELSILKSEIYKVTVMLSEYNEQLKEEKALLSTQMADISHQLKTPLTSMMVMADLLKSNSLPADKRREFTSRIYAQLERLEWLVSSLLKMSKLDAGVVEMNKREVSALSLIESALSPLLISMELKSISYTVETGSGRQLSSEDEPLNICCDIHWTTEALTNILKNCIEHTPPGGKISITAEDNPLYSEIRIADSGTGISKEDMPHIFKRFYRGRNACPDSVGIGLAMAESIISSQGGDILVESRPGEGSVFKVRLYKVVV